MVKHWRTAHRKTCVCVLALLLLICALLVTPLGAAVQSPTAWQALTMRAPAGSRSHAALDAGKGRGTNLVILCTINWD